MSSIIHQAVTSLKAGVPNACSITVTTQYVIAVDLCLDFCVLNLIFVQNSQERGTNKQRKACIYCTYNHFGD